MSEQAVDLVWSLAQNAPPRVTLALNSVLLPHEETTRLS